MPHIPVMKMMQVHGVAISVQCVEPLFHGDLTIKQVLLSSTEAKHVVCSNTFGVAEGHKNYRPSLGIFPDDEAVPIRTHSQGA